MKPLPEAVQRAFPCTEGVAPSRPWWRLAATDYGETPTYRRVDGKMALSMAGVDAEHPLPHPGYRAGQVWVREDGLSIVLTTVAHDWVWTSNHSNGEPPSDFSREYPYLMADPACPHLAPWSPCEEKKP
jgi:hypothetical protein